MNYGRSYCVDCRQYTVHSDRTGKYVCLHCEDKARAELWKRTKLRLTAYLRGLSDVQLLEVGEVMRGVLAERGAGEDSSEFQAMMMRAISGKMEEGSDGCSGQ